MRRLLFLELPGELAGLLSAPCAGGAGGAASDMDAAATQLDEEENVQPLQRDGLDGEEVAREHALRLSSQERSPGRAGTLTGRTDARLAQIFRTVVADTLRPSPLISPTSRW
jgi:hypothetical protein